MTAIRAMLNTLTTIVKQLLVSVTSTTDMIDHTCTLAILGLVVDLISVISLRRRLEGTRITPGTQCAPTLSAGIPIGQCRVLVKMLGGSIGDRERCEVVKGHTSSAHVE